MAFTARATFPFLDSLPRSYFLGHHKAGLDKMRTMISSVDMVIECRDYRVPVTSANPLLERSLQTKHRLVVYTKRDLGGVGAEADVKRERALAEIMSPSTVLFCDLRLRADTKRVLDQIRSLAGRSLSIAGSRMMVVGMPNVGKSTLINALRTVGLGHGHAVRTGNQPGVTRKIGSGVRIVDPGPDQSGGGVYLVDTPGVFMPYVPDPFAMLKLGLCGCVKDSVLPPITVADYLLFHINAVDPSLYSDFSTPTNDISELLTRVGTRTGRLVKGGDVDLESTAVWFIHRWRTGHFGRFVLDDAASMAGWRAVVSAQSQSLDKPSLRQARVLERRGRGKQITSD